MKLWSLCFFLASYTLAQDCPKFECPKSSGNFADPCTCRRFYICADFVAYKNFCPTGLYWHDIRKICTYKNEAICGPVDEETLAANSKAELDDVEKAKKCNETQCIAPFCYCSTDGTKAPVNDPPQFILLMLDGAVNHNNYASYRRLFNKKHKGGKCKLQGTFFLQHEYSNYQNIEQLYSEGHELALISMTTTPDSLQSANETEWETELNVLTETLNRFAGIPKDDIIGVRAPRLKPGYNTQYEVLVEGGYIWDSSIATVKLNTPVWPYTLDYRIPHKCKFDSCPTKSYPGMWEIPLNLHFVDDLGGGECPYLDQCIFTHQSPDDVFDWLRQDFARHYESNRAPYTFPFHTNWFTHPVQEEGLHKFIDWTLTVKDVYYVTATELLIWMSEPSSVDLAKNLVEDCADVVRSKPCNNPNSCELPHTESNGIETLRYMTTCRDCPNKYPWI